MLKNTLILPVDKDELAAQLLEGAIADLNVVLMLIFGEGDAVQQAVQWADKLCDKFAVPGSPSLRRVVWVRRKESPLVWRILEPILGPKPPMIAVLNFHDKLSAKFDGNAPVTPLKLEIAFLKGHKV